MLLLRDLEIWGFRIRPRVALMDHEENVMYSNLSLIDLAIILIDESNVEVTIQKILLLHKYDDQVLLDKNGDDETPLHCMINKYKVKNLKTELSNGYFKVIQVICNLSPDIVMVKSSGRLPLLLLIMTSRQWGDSLSSVSGFADSFRLLLRLYPTAAHLTDPSNTTCRLALRLHVWNPYFYRYLLAADILKPMTPGEKTALSNLNYTERRTALFLAYGNIRYDHDLDSKQESLLTRLRIGHSDLIRRVIMFL